MSIKQQGGIFGRNPTFNNLEVDGEITVGGATLPSAANTAKLDTAQTFTAKQDFVFAGGGNYVAQFQNTTAATPYAVSIKDAASSSNGYPLFIISNSAGSDIYFRVDSGTSDITAGKNIRFLSSGLGIDFSATSDASGSSSELFDDYEEGTWTPTYVPASGAFGSITYDTGVTGGKYTKVGNLVHIQGGIRTDAITVGTASGGIRLGGLPFTAIASGTGQDGWSTLTVGQVAAFAGDVPSTGSVVAGQSYFELQYRSAANGVTIDLAVADLDTGADDNLMRFSATYIAG